MIESDELSRLCIQMQLSGNPLGDFYCFNLTLGLWMRLTDDSMHGNPPYWRSGFGFASINSLFFVFGGNGSSGVIPLSCVIIIRWNSPLQDPKVFLAHLTNDWILAGFLNDLHRFDPSTKSWLQLNTSRLSFFGDFWFIILKRVFEVLAQIFLSKAHASKW